MRKETSSRKSPRKSSGSSVAEPGRRTRVSLGERLLDSIKELRVYLRGEIHLSETVYHVPPETDVRALREKLGLSQSDFAALFGFNVRSLQDWEQGRRRPEIPIRAYLAVIQRDPQAVIRAPCVPPEPQAGPGIERPRGFRHIRQPFSSSCTRNWEGRIRPRTRIASGIPRRLVHSRTF
jgi:putative transcriptional regulator